jgi:hypothetical protein
MSSFTAAVEAADESRQPLFFITEKTERAEQVTALLFIIS